MEVVYRDLLNDLPLPALVKAPVAVDPDATLQSSMAGASSACAKADTAGSRLFNP